MNNRRNRERRREDRRIVQMGAFNGWDGVERRGKEERRNEVRREKNEDVVIEIDPEIIKKKQIKQARREKEREISTKRKEQRSKKEVKRQIN